jgi:hypothetical protein
MNCYTKGEIMAKKRSKKRNYLTQDEELGSIAYDFHICVNRMRERVSRSNMPAAHRMQIFRHLEWFIKTAISYGSELNIPDENAFLSKASTERWAEMHGLFG